MRRRLAVPHPGAAADRRSSANGVTWLMILSGWLAACALLVPGIVGARPRGAADASCRCCGTRATARSPAGGGPSSPMGVFLDKVGHYTAEALIAFALGVRAAGGLGEVDAATWAGSRAGPLLAWLLCLNKALNDMVHVARATRRAATARPTRRRSARRARRAGAAAQRGAVRPVPPHLPLRSSSPLIILVAAVVDAFVGDLDRHPGAARRRSCRSRCSRSSVTSSRSSARAGSGPRERAAAVVRRGRAHPGHAVPTTWTAALRSVLAQAGVGLDVVVVGNGWDAGRAARPGCDPSRCRRTSGSRPAATRVSRTCRGSTCSSSTTTRGCPTPGCSPTLARCFRADPELGLVQPRVVDPTGATVAARAGSRGCARAIRRGQRRRSRSGRAPSRCRAASSSATGGWPAPFFYAHEGIELAWRVWDTGHTVGTPATWSCTIRRSTRRRHAYYYRLNARNRVWLARRNLPVLLEPALRRHLDRRAGRAHLARQGRDARVVRRVPRGLARGPRPTPADQLAHRSPHDPSRPAPHRLTTPGSDRFGQNLQSSSGF